MDTKVVNIPFVGGVNEYNDPDQLPPPELSQCDNAVIRRPGRIEKRHGMTLVQGASGVPATAFNGDSVPGSKVESIEAYYGENGTRAVMAASNTLYEFVGSDADHGWRRVNNLPSYVGTIHGVTASGGSIIETETALVVNNTRRVTAWVSGTRTGQELSSDLAYTSQVNGDGNAVYYAIQDADTGAFIVPPTRLKNALGAYTTSATNLKMTILLENGLEYPLVAWRKSGGDVEYCVINPVAGTVTATQDPWTYLVQNCHRGFDVVASYSDSSSANAVFAFCLADSASSSSASKLPVRLVKINTITGVPTNITTLTNILPTSFPGSEGYIPWATRGIVLDNDPLIPTESLNEYMPFAVRVVSRYYSAPGTATSQLDGQIVVGKLALTGASAVVGSNYARLPFIGFQTKDDHSLVLASPVGSLHYSGSASQSNRLQTGVHATSGAGAIPAPFDTNVIVATATLSDGTKQPYKCSLGVAFTGGISTGMVTIENIAPYKATEQGQISGVNGYPLQTHTYAQDAPITGSYVPIQTNFVDLSHATPNSGFNNGVWTNCVMKAGANTVVTNCTVYVAAGKIVEVAIVDGTSAVAAGAAGGYLTVTSVTGPGLGAGSFNDGRAYQMIVSGVWPVVITDVKDPNSNPPTATYYSNRTGLEHCVHRWSVSQTAGVSNPQVILAVSSTSANLVTTPNGDEVYGAADPHAKNNFFEVYRWNPNTDINLLNISDAGGTTSYCATSLGGPWRLVGSLTRSNGKFLCAVTPAGDDGQRNTFLINIGTGDATVTITQPGKNTNPELSSGSAESFTYTGSAGVFVESCNLMRVTSIPLNTPRLTKTATVATVAALRDGSSKGTESVFAIDYEDTAQNWRRMQVFSDYTFVNGGVPSVFDGVGCNEITSLVWPQKDLTSINWPWQQQDVYIADQNNTNVASQTTTQANAFWNRGGNSGAAGWFLLNITKPYFKYEAGFLDKNGWADTTLGCAWRLITTNWGGDPSKNYETVYSDPRITQFNRANSGAFSFRLSGSNEFTHYYGRYQNNSSGTGGASQAFPLGNTSLWVWAPRAAPNWGAPENSRYTPSDAGGDFLMRWCYEYSDGTGRMVRSAPSMATQYTVCAEIQGAPWTDSTSQIPTYMGGTVSVFQYGFFVPRLELTNRLTTANEDARRVVLQPYTTAEPYSTVLYRMPFSNFENSASDFVISRNATRGVVPWSGDTFDSSTDYPLGLVTTNLKCFDGPTQDYNGILAEPYLYTTGNVLDNVPPPACKAMCCHQNRIVIGGADDPTVVWYSKQITATDGPGFNDQLTITIGDGGPVTGLASLNGNLIIFKEQDVYVVPGTLPDSTGYGPSMGEPFNLPAGVGCIDHRSVVETPVGVYFQSHRGLELLTPALDVIPVTKIRETLQSYPYITNAAHYPANREVWFVCHNAMIDAVITTPSAQVLVFNYQTETWSKFNIGTNDYLGRGMFSIALVGADMWMACTNTSDYSSQAFAYSYDQSVYYDTKRAGDKNYVKMTVVTAPISLNEVQGMQRVKRVRILGTFNPPTGTAEYCPIRLVTATDYKFSLDNLQLADWTQDQVQSVDQAQGRAQLEIHVREQKGQKITFGYVEGQPAAVGATGFGMALSNLALVVGLKSGLDKRITPEAKH